MKVGVLGTGVVGQTLAGFIAELGHDVKIGTRDVEKTLSRTGHDQHGSPYIGEWLKSHPQCKLYTFAEAAQQDLIINATSGAVSLDALRMAGEQNLSGKILMDVANPLDFSHGMPPRLTVANGDSLGEQIQRAFPKTKVVKTLNTVNSRVMVNPKAVAGGDHDIFVSGNDAGAKAQVTDLLMKWFGWKNVIDLGDITTARGVEMLLPLWVQLIGVMQTPLFNFKIVR